MYRLTTTIMIFGWVWALSSRTPLRPRMCICRRASLTSIPTGARSVCLPAPRNLGQDRLCFARCARCCSQMRFRGCVENAIGSAVVKVDRPALTAFYKARTNGRNAAIQIAKNQN